MGREELGSILAIFSLLWYYIIFKKQKSWNTFYIEFHHFNDLFRPNVKLVQK